MSDYFYKFLKFTTVFTILACSNTIIALFTDINNINYIIFSGIFNFVLYLILRFVFRKKYKEYNIKFNYILCFIYILLIFIVLLQKHFFL